MADVKVWRTIWVAGNSDIALTAALNAVEQAGEIIFQTHFVLHSAKGQGFRIIVYKLTKK